MAKNIKIDLPKKDERGRNYLSYSQISTWKKSKRDYIRQYFFGERFEGNSYTDFGGNIGEALESGDFSSYSKKEQELLNKLPRLDSFERRIELHYGEDFYVVGFIDSNSSDFRRILDYKTGDMGKESEYDNDDYFQLEIYAMGLEQETGVLPDKASVILIERTGNAFKGEELKLGTKFIEIERSLSEERLNDVSGQILKIAKEISSYYEIFKKLTGNESVK